MLKKLETYESEASRKMFNETEVDSFSCIYASTFSSHMKNNIDLRHFCTLDSHILSVVKFTLYFHPSSLQTGYWLCFIFTLQT